MKFSLQSSEGAENPARRGRKSHVPRPQKDVGRGVLEIRGSQALVGGVATGKMAGEVVCNGPERWDF